MPTNEGSAAVFNRRAVRHHRQRAIADLHAHSFLLREIAERLAERLEEIDRRFPMAVDLGCRGGIASAVLGQCQNVDTVVGVDCYADLVVDAKRHAPGILGMVADDELLPLASAGVDLVASTLDLHWVNDLPGSLAQIRRALKPDGLFLAAMLGGETLRELRASLLFAESEVEGGASPRVSPFVDVADAGALLQRAGFTLPVADLDTLTVTYPDPLALMRELRGMGETNAAAARRTTCTRRTTLLRAAELYSDRHAAADGRVPATFQVIYMTGWAPHESQQQPLRPGSARSRLADALGTTEQSAGDKTKPG